MMLYYLNVIYIFCCVLFYYDVATIYYCDVVMMFSFL